uniref:Uncharacterized protein n=1 Tax=Rhizophora mucronata TaxID=61149 RepID=A0A2P2QVX4_RHIMU
MVIIQCLSKLNQLSKLGLGTCKVHRLTLLPHSDCPLFLDSLFHLDQPADSCLCLSILSASQLLMC